MSAPRIVVLGDGLVGAMTATALGRAIGPDAVRIVPTGRRDNGLGPFGEAVTLAPDWFADTAGRMAPLDALAARGGLTYSLGTAYRGWTGGDAAWFMPWGEAGAPLGGTAFIQLATRLRRSGQRVRLADHALAALAAQAERFAFPSDDRRSPRSSLALAAHADADGLCSVFTRLHERAGVIRLDGRFAHHERDGERIVALILTDGTRIEADLFVDCSSDGALIAGSGAMWEDWRDRFPFDRVRIERIAHRAAPPPYALHGAGPNGWQAVIPLTEASVVAHFSVDGGTEDAVPFVSGRRDPWRGNCVAIGAAACAIEPQFGLPMLLASRAIGALLDLLPGDRAAGVEREEYNRLAAERDARAADMVHALHALNARLGEPSWDTARTAPRSAALERKFTLHASRGYVPLEDGEPFESEEWLLLLDGMGAHPRRHDPLAAVHSIEAIERHFARLRARLIEEVRAMPAYDRVLASQRSR